LIKTMKKAGCHNIRFGIEAGNARVRNDVVKKRLDETDIVNAFKWCREAGVETMAFFMLGHPTETLADMRETVSLSKRIKPTYADFAVPVPIPGSELFDMMVASGKLEADAWERVINGAPVPMHIPDNVTLEELATLRRKAYRSQYLTPQQIMYQLRSIRTPADLLNKLRAALSVLRSSQRKEPVVW